MDLSGKKFTIVKFTVLHNHQGDELINKDVSLQVAQHDHNAMIASNVMPLLNRLSLKDSSTSDSSSHSSGAESDVEHTCSETASTQILNTQPSTETISCLERLMAGAFPNFDQTDD